MHVYGPEKSYPLAPTCPLQPPDAPVAVYEALMRKLGIERTVVVQPSAYAADNRRALDAVAELGLDRARAVVVVEPGIDDAALSDLTKRGARGLRFHMLAGGILPWSVLPDMAARVGDHGWHVQLQFDGRELTERFDRLKVLPGPVVIDHNGKFLEPVPPDHEAFKALLRLLETGRFWVKVSAPYETSRTGAPAYRDVDVLARALIAAAPERVLWGTNWPHPNAQVDAPEDAALLDLLLDWADSDAIRERILVDNPAALYGFETGR
ncbi:amidohydrolase family protein [Marinivivus vitaminiproducens]|uniref:amidohydrolase family protein n=1 Tax=Marinivivus vitaminiproducens TaxID=3035935 RepID=UPI003FA01FA8